MESPITPSAGIALGAGTGQSFPLVMAIGATMASLPGIPSVEAPQERPSVEWHQGQLMSAVHVCDGRRFALTPET
jgi:hypothetical protein